MKVFAFWEGRAGHTSSAPRRGDYCSGNSWGKLGKPGQLIRPSAALWVQNCIPSEKLPKQHSDLQVFGLWFAWPLPLADAG